MGQSAPEKADHAPTPISGTKTDRIVRFDDYVGNLESLIETHLTSAERNGLIFMKQCAADAFLGAVLGMKGRIASHSYGLVGGSPAEYIDGAYVGLSQKAFSRVAGHSKLMHKYFALQNAAFNRCAACDGLRPSLRSDRLAVCN